MATERAFLWRNRSVQAPAGNIAELKGWGCLPPSQVEEEQAFSPSIFSKHFLQAFLPWILHFLLDLCLSPSQLGMGPQPGPQDWGLLLCLSRTLTLLCFCNEIMQQMVSRGEI